MAKQGRFDLCPGAKLLRSTPAWRAHAAEGTPLLVSHIKRSSIAVLGGDAGKARQV